MNILILNWKDLKNPDVGGAEIILLEFARRLIKEGHTVTWFSRRFKGCVDAEITEGIQIIRRGTKLSVYIEAYRYYRNLRIKPDIVFDCVNTICFFTPFYVPQKKRIMYVNQLAKEVLFYELPLLLSVFSFVFERFEYLPYRSTRTICYSQSTKEDLEKFGIPKDHISVFPLGIDHDRYKPGKKSKYPLFIFVARLVNMKRPLLVIEAMKEVIRDFPKAKLAVIGNGPLESKINSIIENNKLQKHVVLVSKNNLFFNKHAKDLKTEYMQKAWAQILPSVKEGWGMVVTEAAACGTPSIVTNVTGLRDSVIPDITGIIISPNPKISDLTETMRNIIKNKKHREYLSKHAIEFARTFTWETSYSTFKQFLV